MPVEPKVAATVVILRERESNSTSTDDCKFEVFMAKRHENAKFMSEHHVFPGGSIEEQDASPESRARIIGLEREDTSNLKDICDDPSNLWVIAIRELFEETGILIASKESGRPIEIDEENIRKYKKYQEKLQKDQITITEIFTRENLYYPANELKYFGRLITPKSSPIRFDTQFFLCQLPLNQEISLFKDELTEGLWGTPKQLLDLFRKKQIKIIFPQFSTLNRLKRYKTISEAIVGP